MPDQNPSQHRSPRAATVGTIVVALASAAISYRALAELGRAASVPEPLHWLYPVVIDGTIGVGTAAALSLSSVALRTRAYVWLVLGSAIAVSVVGNALHARAQGGALELAERDAMAVSAVPALALAASLHLLVILTREGAQEAYSTPERAHSAPVVSVRAQGAGSASERAHSAPEVVRAQSAQVSPPPARKLVNAARAPRAGTVVARATDSGSLDARTAALIEQWTRAGEPVTSVRLARELGCSAGRVRHLSAWHAHQNGGAL